MKRTNTATWYESQHRWQIKVQKNGIRKTFYSGVPGRAGQRECNAKADAWLDDGVENPNAKISRLTAEYLENLKLTASTSHYTQYEKYVRLYIDPKIGNVRISDLHEQHLQSVIDYGYSKKLAKKTEQAPSILSEDAENVTLNDDSSESSKSSEPETVSSEETETSESPEAANETTKTSDETDESEEQ